MGCDIHLLPEMKDGSLWFPIISELIPGVRNYELFARMANVRNNDGIIPIAEPRGIPHDSGSLTRRLLSDPSLHTPSWLSSSEVLYDATEYDPSGCLIGLAIYIRSIYYTPTWRLVFAFDN